MGTGIRHQAPQGEQQDSSTVVALVVRVLVL